MRTLVKEAQNAQGKREAARAFFEQPWHLRKEKISPPKKNSKTKWDSSIVMFFTVGVVFIACVWRWM